MVDIIVYLSISYALICLEGCATLDRSTTTPPSRRKGAPYAPFHTLIRPDWSAAYCPRKAQVAQAVRPGGAALQRRHQTVAAPCTPGRCRPTRLCGTDTGERR